MSTIIGLVSTFRLPLQKLVGLDVEAEGRHDEVQKRSQSWLDWTFMQRKGTKKSNPTSF